MGIQEHIEEKTKELYKERYGKRSPDTLSIQGIEKVRHDAAIEVQKRRRELGK